jgi:hypothetical protein
MENNITYIYYLHKGNNIPFYIGKSINSKFHRMYQHKKTYGLNIFYEILDIVDSDKWKFWECYWISQFKTWGFELTNKNNGGGGPISYTDESKKLKSDTMKQSWKSGSFKRNWSKQCINLENQKIYPTLKDAQIDLNLSTFTLYKTLGEGRLLTYI